MKILLIVLLILLILILIKFLTNDRQEAKAREARGKSETTVQVKKWYLSPKLDRSGLFLFEELSEMIFIKHQTGCISYLATNKTPNLWRELRGKWVYSSVGRAAAS